MSPQRRWVLWLLVGGWPLALVAAPPEAGPAPAGGPATEPEFQALLEFLGETDAAEKGWDEFVASLPDRPDEAMPTPVRPERKKDTGQ